VTAHALAAREMQDHVGGCERNDQIAERDHLLTERDDVAEHAHRIAGALDVASAAQLDELDVARRHDVRDDQSVWAHGHAAVGEHHEEVEAEADREYAHAGEMQVGDAERDQRRERAERQHDGEVPVDAR